MKYKLRQKIFAFGDDFTIQDDTGRDCYFVDGKVFSIGDKLSFQDMNGNELARIEQEVLTIGTKYRILRNGREFAHVRKKMFTLFRDAFDIEDREPGDFDAEGDFFDHEYRFTRNGRAVATVSKRFFSLSDTYGVEVAPGEDDVLILACAVVIDLCSHDD